MWSGNSNKCHGAHAMLVGWINDEEILLVENDFLIALTGQGIRAFEKSRSLINAALGYEHSVVPRPKIGTHEIILKTARLSGKPVR